MWSALYTKNPSKADIKREIENLEKDLSLMEEQDKTCLAYLGKEKNKKNKEEWRYYEVMYKTNQEYWPRMRSRLAALKEKYGKRRK